MGLVSPKHVGPSRTRARTCVPCIGRRILNHCVIREALDIILTVIFFFFNFLAVLGLRFCARAFSGCGKQGPLFIAVRGPLTIAASLVGSTGSRRADSVVVAHGPSCSAACGIFPDQGLIPCPLHWQADSQPLRHHGSPTVIFFKLFDCLFCL